MGLKVKELLTVFLRIDTRLHQESTEKEWNTIINANRIAGAEVTIEGTKYLLDKNDNQNNLHSGFNRSHHKLYSVRNGKTDACEFVEMERYSPNMEQGFPGNLEQKIRYTLTDKNEFIIDYEMLSDMTTVVNPTNHSYFNLDGHNSGTIFKHYMEIYSGQMLELGNDMIPTGEIIDISDTPFDFRKSKQIGKDGAIYNKRSGVCFETQFYPNSCNNPEFPSCILPAYKIFKSRTVYQFFA